jgi:hypothetical protein
VAVVAAGYDGANINISGAVTATGAGSKGVAAYSFNNYAYATVGKVTADQTAVEANSEKGYAGVTVNGAVKSNNGVGALAVAYFGGAGVSVSHGASVTGATDAVQAFSYSGSWVYNHGAIATTSTTTGFAINATASYSGPVVVANYADGVISGPVKLAGVSGSSLSNAGTWNVWGTSQIGTTAAKGVVTNSGTVNVAPTATSATTVSITNLATWNNSGVISLQNGHTGDVLTLGTSTFAASGASTLKVDAALTGATTSDKLVVGAVTGTTVINVHDIAGGSPASLDLVGATVAQATSGTAGSFSLAGGTIHKGFVDYALLFNASNTTWNLVGLPSHASFEVLKLPALSQGFADRSNEVWYWRQQEVRDSEALGSRKPGWEFWGQVYGGDQTIGHGQTFAMSGFSFTENLQTKSQWGGVQFGLDHLSDWQGGKLLFGFTAGYLDQWSQFAGGASGTWAGGTLVEPTSQMRDTLRLNGMNVGGYVGFAKGGFFINGLAKADFATAKIGMNTVPFNASTEVTMWNLRGEFGYRYGTQNFFVEPVVRYGGADTSISSFSGGGATATFPDAGDFEIAPGARVGGQVAAGGIVWAPYVGAYWVDQPWLANRVTLDNGGGLSVRDQAQKGFARIDFGATAKTPFGAEGFLKSTVDTGSNVTGWSANLGLRWRF